MAGYQWCGNGCPPSDRLVKEQEVRTVDQGSGDRHALFLAAADLPRFLVGTVLHRDQGQHPVDLVVDLVPANTP